MFVAELSTTLDEFEPQPDTSDVRLVLYRHLGGVNRDLFESRAAAPGAVWSSPVPLDSLNAPGSERSPCLVSNGLEIWFASDRQSGAQDIHDVFRATRSSLDVPFEPPGAVDILNSAQDDDDPWLSPDGRVILFSSTRDGNPEIYEAQR
jgi:Tol biopolymer transport system component